MIKTNGKLITYYTQVTYSAPAFSPRTGRGTCMNYSHKTQFEWSRCMLLYLRMPDSLVLNLNLFVSYHRIVRIQLSLCVQDSGSQCTYYIVWSLCYIFSEVVEGSLGVDIKLQLSFSSDSAFYCQGNIINAIHVNWEMRTSEYHSNIVHLMALKSKTMRFTPWVGTAVVSTNFSK